MQRATINRSRNEVAMSILLEEPPTLAVASATPSAGSDVGTQVRALLTSLYPKVRHRERRSTHRFPYPHLIRLTPVLADGPVLCDAERLVVAGKNISEAGICFFHHGPLALRRAIVSLESNGGWVNFLTDLTWCRFTRHGWYESGGIFLAPAPTPPGLRP